LLQWCCLLALLTRKQSRFCIIWSIIYITLTLSLLWSTLCWTNHKLRTLFLLNLFFPLRIKRLSSRGIYWITLHFCMFNSFRDTIEIIVKFFISWDQTIQWRFFALFREKLLIQQYFCFFADIICRLFLSCLKRLRISSAYCLLDITWWVKLLFSSIKSSFWVIELLSLYIYIFVIHN